MPERRAGFIVLGVVGATWGLALFVFWIHVTLGPPVRYVHVRWAAEVSESQRAAAERDWRLVDRRPTDDRRTFRYLLHDRSRRNVSTILSSPLVNDTAYLDLKRLRVQLDPPDPRNVRSAAKWAVIRLPWLWSLTERDWMPNISVTLGVIGVLVVLANRRPVGIALLWLCQTVAFMWSRLVAAFRSPDSSFANVPVRRAEFAVGVTLGVLFLIPLLVYGPYEEEVIQHSIFPAQMFYRALFSGRWPFWMNELGFGTPLPLGDTLMFHPLFGPLAAFTSLRVTLTVVWLAHVILMTVYFLRLAAVSGVRTPLLRTFLLASYLLSIVSMTYFYATDWVTNAVTWCLYPALVFQLRSAATGQAQSRFWPTTVALAVLVGFWILNGHPGYIAPLLTVLAVYAVVCARLSGRVYLCFCISGLLCAAILSAHVYHLIHEAQLFPPGTSLSHGGVTWWGYVAAALAADRPGRNAPFIGLAMCLGIVGMMLRFPSIRDAHVRACVVAVTAAVAFGLVPRQVSQWIAPSGSNLFCDAFVFFGLLVSGAALQRWFDSPRPVVRSAALALVLLQVVQQRVVIVEPVYGDFFSHQPYLRFYQYQGHPYGVGKDLVEAAETFGPRVYFSPQMYLATRGRLSRYGLHFSSDLVFLGLNPVNGWFKNVSMSRIYPAASMMESIVNGDVNVLHNPSLLDVLGINVVVMAEQEEPVPDGLRVLKRLAIPWMRQQKNDVLITANPDAWPKAVLMDAQARDVRLPVHVGCSHSAALCLDYSPLVGRRLPGEVTVKATDGEYTLTFPSRDAERLLFMSSLYRAEWEAVSSEGVHLRIDPIADAFLGITVPAGATKITVSYVPRVQKALTYFSSLALGFFVVAWCALFARGRMLKRRGTTRSSA